MGLLDLGVMSIEFKILSSDLDRENIDDVCDTVDGCAMRGGLNGVGGNGGGGSYDEHKLATDGL